MRPSTAIRWLKENPFWADVLLGLVLCGVALPGLWLAQPTRDIEFRHPDALGVALVALSTLPLAWRRRSPLVVLSVVGTTAMLIEALGYSSGVGGVGVLVALYTVAAHCNRKDSRIALAITGVALVIVFVTARWEPNASAIAGNVVIFVTAWVMGDNLQTRRAYLASVEERAERLEREQARLAEQAVADERARIARELHDVVAHNVSVMVVQAGAARRVMDRSPEQAEDALRSIESTGRTALDELRRLLGVMRPNEAAGTRAEREPQPSVEHLDVLVQQMRDAGLPVELVREGAPHDLPTAVDLSVYRIAQEALTNALKHAGPARARVVVRYGEGCVELVVSDDGRGLAASLNGSPSGGHGLVGMRERVALFGGTLRAGARPGGGYEVRASIPLDRVHRVPAQ